MASRPQRVKPGAASLRRRREVALTNLKKRLTGILAQVSALKTEEEKKPYQADIARAKKEIATLEPRIA